MKFIKNLLSVLCFMFIAHTANAQARIGYTSAAIREEYSASNYALKSGYLNDGTLYIQITTYNSTVYYFFNSNYICESTVIQPDNQGALNSIVETYNKQYVIIDSTHWKMYNANGICTVELVYPDSGGYFFVWKAG